ncbi:MAG: HPr family phosphocarrier protein [Clostridiales bacterium]|nr:HPr family phosphocarrier protein [Clostridiales bacterium]
MKNMEILIDSINKIKELNKIALECDRDVDLVSGKYITDAKSLAQIVLLNLDNKIKIVFESDDDFEKVREKLENIFIN